MLVSVCINCVTEEQEENSDKGFCSRRLSPQNNSLQPEDEFVLAETKRKGFLAKT